MVLDIVPCGAMSHKCEIFIPLFYERRRTRVEPEVLQQIVQGFNTQFGGFTPLGMTSSPPGVEDGGGWVDPDTGEVINDICWVVRVYVEPDQIAAFKRMAISIGRQLEQKQMLIDIGPDTGMFLKIVDPEREPRQDKEKDRAKDQEDDKPQKSTA